MSHEDEARRVLALIRHLSPEQVAECFAEGELDSLAKEMEKVGCTPDHDLNLWQLACDVAAGDKPMPDTHQIVIPLPNGGSLRCDEGEEFTWGSAVRVCDAQGIEIVMWDSQEWGDSPEEVMGAIFGIACRPNLSEVIHELGRTRIEDGCWV